MPRYFLHVRTKQGPVIPDRIGIEFRNLAAAGGLSLSLKLRSYWDSSQTPSIVAIAPNTTALADQAAALLF